MVLAIEDASKVLRGETIKFLEQRDGPLALEFSKWGFFGRHDVLFASTEIDARSVEWYCLPKRGVWVWVYRARRVT